MTTGDVLPVGPKAKTYADISIAFLRGNVSVGRAWLLVRSADPAGRGYHAIADIRATFADPTSPFHLWTWRHWRDVLPAGEELGVWSIYDETLRTNGWAATAHALGIAKLRGRAVLIPVKGLTQGNQLAAAHLLASVESARPVPGPMSRARLEELTGVPPSTQRMYDALLGRDSQTNIVVTNTPWTSENVQEHAWMNGHNVMPFVDHDGQRGPVGAKYIAYQLPSTRELVHEHAPRGRQRKANARLRDLVHQRGQGNPESGVTAVYHENAKEAASAFNRNPGVKHYYIEGRQFVPDANAPSKLQQVTVWGVIE